MSAKWVRSQQWDDRFFSALGGWSWPVKFILRAFSSIALAVTLLSLVALYGILASVPIGMLAGIPTWLIYIATLLVFVGVLAVLPSWWLARTLVRRGVSPATRFVATFATFAATAALAWTAWYTLLWPVMYFDPLTGSGLRLFPEFCETYKRTMLRQLPIVEMSEMEFYSWWPLRLVLLAFVINLTTATLRRIEFKFMNLGVLTVHTGIITIALGSMYYGALKQEGDVFLLAGRPDNAGNPTIGQPASGFFLNPEQVDPALWIAQQSRGGKWDMRTIPRLPRYNDYWLDAAGRTIGGESRAASDHGRSLSIPVPPSERQLIDDDIRFRVVGYASYGETRDTWVNGEGMGGSQLVRHVELLSTLPGRDGGERPGRGKFADLMLAPQVPADRATLLRDPSNPSFIIASVEYVEGINPERWLALQAELPAGAMHGLLIEIPAAGVKQLYAVEPGKTLDVPGGWQVLVKELHPEPPISIITPGFEGATSPVAIVRVQPPTSAGAAAAPAFDRYIYSRFPELNQDLLDERQPSGMPKRRAADAAIKITYIDASTMNIVIDGGEAGGWGGGGASPRAIVRMPGRSATVVDSLKEGTPLQLAPMVSLHLGKRYAQAEKIDAPWPVPDEQRDRDLLRTRRSSQVAVEVSTVDKAGVTTWSTVLWLMNNPWHPVQSDPSVYKEVTLPDNRSIVLAYGRRFQSFPGFQIALRDFEMTPYPHTTTPKDYRSDLAVMRFTPGADVRPETHSTSMNNPLLLRVPFQRNPEAPPPAVFAGWLVSWIAPNQYKLSQNSWDPAGWNETKAMADRGELARPFARFTIIGVGNNPGIYIIATGGVLMAVGIPWAFYVKPWLVRRQKARIQAELAAKGLLKRPAGGGPIAGAAAATSTNGVHGATAPHNVAVIRSES